MFSDLEGDGLGRQSSDGPMQFEARQSIGLSFAEHRLSVRELCEVHPLSQINAQQPEVSAGLDVVEAM